ncbi:hypothetical protein KFL_000560370 [Klebsormidium nitens]|uniref:RNase III domain-containing protein n=1 Tax=Klebsormidium nitens TaxID=105231 RepID=A0A1Y1HXG0_KLENI|nr:hypothetical protein KFL_000560370 [Klebsormidium nitens]|eukprot:GAQ80548.1 hypothetical protein KFL_000560370 [Klebsormidium nitens]
MISAPVLGRLQENAEFSRLANGAKEKKESKPRETGVEIDLDELMGQDLDRGTIGSGWLPPPPEIARPRAQFNAGTMAYLGDGVYQMYAKRHFLLPPKTVNALNERVLGLVRCETQAAMLRKLCNGAFLTEEERAIVRWGKNAAQDSSRKAIRRAGGKAYGEATALETLIGFLYLTDPSRLDALMTHIGFSFNSSTIAKEELEGIPTDVPNENSPGERLEAVGESREAPGLDDSDRLNGVNDVKVKDGVEDGVKAVSLLLEAMQNMDNELGASHRGTSYGEAGHREAPGSAPRGSSQTAEGFAKMESASFADAIDRLPSAAAVGKTANTTEVNGTVLRRGLAVPEREPGEERGSWEGLRTHVSECEIRGSSPSLGKAESSGRRPGGSSGGSLSGDVALSQANMVPPEPEGSAGALTGASTGASTGRSGSLEQSETGARALPPECPPEVKEVWEKTKRLLWQKYQLRQKLSPEDRDFVMQEILTYHPNATAKIGCGVEAITVDFSMQSRANRCFHVIRNDGSQEDFSYLKCLRVRRGIL